MLVAKNYAEELVRLRRHFHRIAEPGWFEFETTLDIIASLKEGPWKIQSGRKIHDQERMGLPSDKERADYLARYVDHKALIVKADGLGLSEAETNDLLDNYTGLVADYDTGRPGPYVVIRFDIDALPMRESQSPDHRPNREGFAESTGRATHACGHDAHISLGLCCAKIIASSEILTGKYRLIFQPAEEGTRGAYSMVKRDLACGADFLLASHIGLGIPSGKVGVGSEYFLASSKYDLNIQGREAHAASNPEDGRSALLGAASLALSLSYLTQVGKGKAWLNVGELRSGTAANIVPGEAELRFELRSDRQPVLEQLAEKVARMVEGEMSGRELTYQLERVTSADALDEKYLPAYRHLGAGLAAELGSQGFDIILSPQFGASEDVVAWINKVWAEGGQVMHLMLGADISASHHNPAFDLDESALPQALGALEATLYYFQGL
ncbi:MAG: amidohydrolase [Eubacteriales bacterium]|nr:amidohydrolase [Eubacteriales bacterium]